MFERFTDRARKVIVLGQDAARVHKNEAITVEHLLVGIIDEGEGVGFKAIEAAGIDTQALREDLVKMFGPEHDRGIEVGHIPFTLRAKKILELSLREALQLGHNYIGTEHILLGILREGDSPSVQRLEELGFTQVEARRQVIAIASTGKPYTGELTTPAGEPYPETVQLFLKRLAERVVVDPSLRDHFTAALEAVAEERVKQARHALRKDVRAYLDLLVD